MWADNGAETGVGRVNIGSGIDSKVRCKVGWAGAAHLGQGR